MSPNLAALSGAGTILLALVFFYFPWQSFVIDQTRQRLFELRDHWFDLSQQFSDADKKTAIAIRAELNYMIRMLHEFTVPVLAYCVALHYILGVDPEKGEDHLQKMVQKFNSKEARNEATKIISNAIMQITYCMVRRSLFMLVLMPVIIAGFILVFATMGSAKTLGVSLEKSVANLALRENRQLVPNKG